MLNCQATHYHTSFKKKMNFLLKIIEGPNKGAEVALEEGVSVTLGKGDECDIVLADGTLPAQVTLLATDDYVTVDGERLEALHVKTLGATSFAVGPVDAPWGELVWQKESAPEAESSGEKADEAPEEKAKPETPGESPAKDETSGEEAAEEEKKKKHGGCLGCLVALILFLLILALACWFFREDVKPLADKAVNAAMEYRKSESSDETCKPPMTLEDISGKYGLTLEDGKLSGNFATRSERLAATAEAYATAPGVELDLTDDESFRIAAEDALFTLTEGSLRVSVATNRYLAISGYSRSPASLGRALKALAVDLPRLNGVDTSGVSMGLGPVADASGDDGESTYADDNGPEFSSRVVAKSTTPSLPVCGILVKPYPCLVMKDGRRLMEGASIGDNMILKIEADTVTLTNSTGRFEWKP